jgi:nicotinamide mononucleotide adenylyltransferase
MFEMAKDHLLYTPKPTSPVAPTTTIYPGKYQILGGYLSPVSDAYNKPGLCSAHDRVQMARLACQQSNWLMVDEWESLWRQGVFERTASVLDHFDECVNAHRPNDRRVRVMLLAGGDLIESFQVPGLWAPEDLHHILGDYGCLVLERTGADTHSFLLENDVLYQHRHTVFVIKQLIHNDISSTKVRLFVKRGFSIRYLVPDPVVEYIYQHRLFLT